MITTPRSKANLFNTALPAAEASLVAADIVVTVEPGYLMAYFVPSIAGILRFARTRAGVTVAEDLNQGVALTAGSAYEFSVAVRSEDTGNFRFSATGGTYTLLVEEYGED